MQDWFEPHPYGTYPRGNAKSEADIFARFGTLSTLVTATAADDKEHTEQPYLDLFQYLMSFMTVADLARLSRACTGWYVMVHCSDAFKQAYTALCPSRLVFRGSWKESAVRAYLESESLSAPETKLSRREKAPREQAHLRHFPYDAHHVPVRVSRAFFCDQLFQAWMCTILPTHYHLIPRRASAHSTGATRDTDVDTSQTRPAAERHVDGIEAADTCGTSPSVSATTDPTQNSSVPPQYKSAFKPVPRCDKLSPDEFRERFETPNTPVVLTGIATEWPLFKILNGDFSNFATKKRELLRPGVCDDALFRCEYTTMSIDDYVQYARDQLDERPIYMFDAEFGSSLDAERLYQVPPHFARDDFFSVLGAQRPKHRWIIAGPARGGSSFHVDPNYTNAWNANMTGRKRWLLFPPGATPPGVVPSENMAEVATPVSLTEWLLNFYDESVGQLRHSGYECICEPGDIMFVPCGWWHYVINLEDSLAITQNYVSECNLSKVIKFLRAMKSSISGIDEDKDEVTEEAVRRRQGGFAKEFTARMTEAHPALMKRIEAQLESEREERQRRRMHQVAMLDSGSDGFKFAF